MAPKIIYFLFSFFTAPVFGQDCYWNRQCAYQLYSSKTPYDSIRGDIRDVPLLEGCEAISLWTLNRHGNRNPGSSVTASMKIIAGLRDDIVASYEAGTSQLCAQDIDEFRRFTWNETLEVSASYLTETGYEELHDLAQRIRQKYPHLVQTTDESLFYFRPTVEQRTITSAIAYTHGLSEGLDLNLTVDDAREVEEVIRPYSTCERYQVEVRGDDAPFHYQIAKYQNTSEYTAVQYAVQQRLGISYQLTKDDVYAFYEICRFYRSWSFTKQSPWCSVFSEEDLLIMEYRDDIRHYYRNGYGAQININLGKPVLRDLYENFVAATEGRGRNIVAYFTHDTMMQMAFSAMGLFKDDFILVGETMVPSRLWRTSYIASFTTNIIAVLNRCGDSASPDFRVQMFVNEKESTLCPSSGCSWEDFEQHFQSFTSAGLEFCSLDYVMPTTAAPLEVPDSASLTSSVLLSLVISQVLLYFLSIF